MFIVEYGIIGLGLASVIHGASPEYSPHADSRCAGSCALLGSNVRRAAATPDALAAERIVQKASSAIGDGFWDQSVRGRQLRAACLLAAAGYS